MTLAMMNNYLFDENLTRYQLVKSNPGKAIYNWLFFPGGPGIDSNYLLHLINEINVEGNYWLVDLLFNGGNVSDKFNSTIEHKHWGHHFLSAMNKFDNPILVGHSFGGYYPLFFPELEKILKGFVILNSAPTLPTPPTMNIEEFEKRARDNDLPFGAETVATFLSNPTMSTIKERYLSLVPYAFPADNLVQGIKVVENLIFNVDTGYWWLTEGAKIYSTINWIPEKTPMLILGGNHDLLTPLSLFEEDLRFQRNNIDIISISNAGHFPWIEQPTLIKDAFCSFIKKIDATS